jgi:hypothetical protein
LELLQELWSLDGPTLVKYPNSEFDSVGTASKMGAVQSVSMNSTGNPRPSISTLPDGFYPQSFEPVDEHWSSPPASDQTPGPRPGMSVEQMLADAGTLNTILDDELMSMWMAAPTDIS